MWVNNDKTPIYNNPKSWDRVGYLNAGDEVTVDGPAATVGGYTMVPISRPRDGIVERKHLTTSFRCVHHRKQHDGGPPTGKKFAKPDYRPGAEAGTPPEPRPGGSESHSARRRDGREKRKRRAARGD
eukprot:gene1894-56467_t